MASGPEDNVAEYYQQQGEMLEGFTEMDALAERGFIPGMSKVRKIITFPSASSCLALDLKLKLGYCFGFRKSEKSWLKVKHLPLEYPMLQTWLSFQLKSMHPFEVVP